MRPKSLFNASTFTAAAVCALALSGCGGQPSALPQAAAPQNSAPAVFAERTPAESASRRFFAGPSTPTHAANAMDSATDASYTARADAPVPLFEGKPMWAPNRKHSAEDNAQYQFSHHGEDFHAKTEEDYVSKAHAFIDHPPAGAETIERRNGDRLIYDQSSNTFAVASRDGAPRTLFRPRTGADYWAEQKEREAARARESSNSGAGQN
jgi:pyocin large subunit-like protein